MRIVFMGTPEFAVPTLAALHEAGHTILVITQPDKKQGRKQILTPPPIKAYATEHGIEVKQFERIKSDDGVAAIRDFAPELMVTAAYGQILSAEILDIPPKGCINVHASLLPKLRGAAPIQQSILDGERTTGVTTMLTDVGLDTGDMLLKCETEIMPDETTAELTERLSHMGAELLMETLKELDKGTLNPTPQDHALATKCKPITRDMAKLDFTRTAQELHNTVRAMNPWPGAFAYLDDETLKIWRTRPADSAKYDTSGIPCGARVPAKTLLINTGDGVLELLEVQPQNGKRMDGKSFLNGKSGRKLTDGKLT